VIRRADLKFGYYIRRVLAGRMPALRLHGIHRADLEVGHYIRKTCTEAQVTRRERVVAGSLLGWMGRC
jgi:hypothetical protein